MQIRNGFVSKDIVEAPVGDLLCFELEQRQAWGVMLRHTDSHVLIGVLSAEGLPGEGPFSLEWSYPMACISYGADWELEPLPGTETFPGNEKLRDVPGVMHATNDGLCIRFGPEPKKPRSGFYWNFATNAPGRWTSGDSAPILQWRIWPNSLAPRHAGELPLVEYKASQQRQP